MVAALIKRGGLDVNKPDEYGLAFSRNALRRSDKDLTIAKRLINREGADLRVATTKGARLHCEFVGVDDDAIACRGVKRYSRGAQSACDVSVTCSVQRACVSRDCEFVA